MSVVHNLNSSFVYMLCGSIILVVALICVLFTLVPGLISSTSMMIIPSGALAILLAWLSYRKPMEACNEIASCRTL